MRLPLVIPSIGMQNGLQVWINEGRITIQLFDTPDRVMEATFDKDDAQRIKQYINTA